MFKLFIILFILAFSSCGQYQLSSQISKTSNNVLSHEGFLRYSPDAIESSLKNNLSLSGVALCHMRKFEEGRELLQKQLEEKKEDPNYWVQVGTCFYLNSQFTKAEYYYQISIQKASEKKVKSASAFNNLGLIYLKKRHFQKAFQNFKTALSIDKSILTPRYNMAQLYLQFGKNNLALKEYQYLSKFSSKDPDILFGLATAHTMEGDIKKGLDFFFQIPKGFKSRPDIATKFALALYLDKQYEQAYLALKNQSTTKIKSVRQMTKKLLQLIEIELNKKKLAAK